MQYSIGDSNFGKFALSTPARAVGYWQLPGADNGMSVQFAAWKKPRWITIKMMWLVFEWKWIEAK
jgi:hypothetical protein